MNPSSLGIDVSAVQRQKNKYKWFGSEQSEDEGSPSTIENIISARQQPERSGAHEYDEGGRITYLKLERYL
jgi:hypothetical protein